MSQTNPPPNHSYWLIEPDEFSALSKLLSLHPFNRAFCSWVARKVQDALALEDSGVYLTVIEAEYVGEYPCLAAYSSKRDNEGFSMIPDELADKILGEIRRTLRETTVGDLLVQIGWGEIQHHTDEPA